MTHYTPTTETEVAEAVTAARAARTPLRIVGGGTRAGYGRPVEAPATLALSGLAGITLYEPAEMVIGARAGTPLTEIEQLLASHKQMLPFEPVDYRPIYGWQGEPTIGAVAAGNFSGSRRISAGAARDSLIGLRFVNGRGEVIKSGGRVMKNVTGLDLVKLQSGALGTLGVLTEVIFKVLPRPETVATLVLRGLDDARAIAALSAALTTPYDVSGAAHLPATAQEPARTCLRLEGFVDSVRYRAAELARLLKAFGPAEILNDGDSIEIWWPVSELHPVSQDKNDALWRISVKPTDGPKVMERVGRAVSARAYYYDWGGGLIWLSVAPGGDLGAAVIRAAVAELGGHATLVRASAEARRTIPVFQPQPQALSRLAEGIRRSVDPDGLFNPGLMG